MIEYIRQTITIDKKWLDSESFTKAFVICQSLPGAIVVNTAALCGYQIKGLIGMFTVFVAFLLPSFLIMLIFSYFYAETKDLTLVKSIFTGLEVIVVAIVLNATFRFCKDRLKKDIKAIVLSLISTILIMQKLVPLVVILLMACVGILFYTKQMREQIGISAKYALSLNNIYIVSAIFLVFYCLIYFFNRDIFELSYTMTKIALMSFGGVYTAMPIMFHEVVEVRAWMNSKTFMDGLALGQITPGPILINSVFIGYMTNGFLGAVAGTFAIFFPGPLLICIVMPFFNKIGASPYFKSATKGMIFAFAGLLIFIAIKFIISVEWNLIKFLLLSASIIWLVIKNNVLYLSIAGVVLSILIF